MREEERNWKTHSSVSRLNLLVLKKNKKWKIRINNKKRERNCPCLCIDRHAHVIIKPLILSHSFFQLSPSEGDHILESKLGNFNIAAQELINDQKQFYGINTPLYPSTPTQVRAPPGFPSSATNNNNNSINNNKQSSISNGNTSSSSTSSSSATTSSLINNNNNNISSSRTYNNNINNNNTQNNSQLSNNNNNYQQQQQQQQSSSQKSSVNLLPAPSSRVNSNSSASSNSTFLRPADSKPYTNGIGRLPIPQLNKHEVNITLHFIFYFSSFLLYTTLHFTLLYML